MTELNLTEEILDIQEGETWSIKDDTAADWCLDHIREAKAELARFEMVANEKKRQIDIIVERKRKNAEGSINYFEGKLQEYFSTIKPKITKSGLQKYSLPSGELQQTAPKVDFVKDDTKLTNFLDSNGYGEYLKREIKPKWAELKKAVDVVNGEVVIKDTGEIVDGVTVETKPGEFKIKL